jgi:hypothetical protein
MNKVAYLLTRIAPDLKVRVGVFSDPAPCASGPGAWAVIYASAVCADYGAACRDVEAYVKQVHPWLVDKIEKRAWPPQAAVPAQGLRACDTTTRWKGGST